MPCPDCGTYLDGQEKECHICGTRFNTILTTVFRPSKIDLTKMAPPPVKNNLIVVDFRRISG